MDYAAKFLSSKAAKGSTASTASIKDSPVLEMIKTAAELVTSVNTII
jgi:hypothetical protein